MVCADVVWCVVCSFVWLPAAGAAGAAGTAGAAGAAGAAGTVLCPGLSLLAPLASAALAGPHLAARSLSRSEPERERWEESKREEEGLTPSGKHRLL